MGLFDGGTKNTSDSGKNAARYEILDALGYIISFMNPDPVFLAANPRFKAVLEHPGLRGWTDLVAMQLITAAGHLYGNPEATRAAEIMTQEEFDRHCVRPSSLGMMKTDMRRRIFSAKLKVSALGYSEAAESLGRALVLVDNMSYTNDSFDPGF